jgi:hypothetical protein
MSIGFVNLVRYAVRQATVETRLPATLLRRGYIFGTLKSFCPWRK